MTKEKSELLRGTLVSLVLSVIERRSLYGYEIAKEVRVRTGGILHLKEGSLYPALHAMERDGLLVAEWQAAAQGPSRKYYRLTRKGRSALRRRRSQWSEFRDATDAVLRTRPAEEATS